MGEISHPDNMKSFNELHVDYQNITEDDSAANLVRGKKYLNDSQRKVLAYMPWPFLETTDTKTSVASQNNYQIPATFRKVTSVNVTVGTTVYRPRPVESSDFWEYLQSLSTSESDATQFFYVQGNEVLLYPTIATAGSTITFRGRRRWKDLSIDDYSTGTIVTATNGDETIVGGSTVWTGLKPISGQWIRIDVVTGDFEWYKIDSITDDTNLELVKPYEGTSITTGTETYKIGEFSIIPSEYHDLMLWRACAIYFMQNEQDLVRADRFWNLYDGGYEAGNSKEIGGLLGIMEDDAGGKAEGVYIDPLDSEREDLRRFRIDTVTGESW